MCLKCVSYHCKQKLRSTGGDKGSSDKVLWQIPDKTLHYRCEIITILAFSRKSFLAVH